MGFLERFPVSSSMARLSVDEAVARAQQLATLRAAGVERATRRAAALRAARPNFSDVETLFSAKLPAHLRTAWERHYDGATVGFGFIEARRGALDELEELAEVLGRCFEPVDALGLPYRLFPFGMGEQDDEFIALDLARPTRAGDDYAVVVAGLERGLGWVTHPSSFAWLEDDGVNAELTV
jgi:hypothetical protein